MDIPFYDLNYQHQALKEELRKTFEDRLSKGVFAGIEEVASFEKSFAEYLGVNQFLACSNGTDALMLALESLGLQAGDKVILPSYSCQATWEAVVHLGLDIHFVDVKSNNLLLDFDLLTEEILQSSKALIFVSLYGNKYNSAQLKDFKSSFKGLIIEDASHAHGLYSLDRPNELQPDAMSFSFYPTKNLGALGEAGGVYLKDPKAQAKAKGLLNHGIDSNGKHEFPGWNRRMDPLQADILELKLTNLDDWNELRKRNASIYKEELKEKFKMVSYHDQAVYHQFCIFSEERDRLQSHLEQNGIGTGIHYPYTLTELAGISKPFPRADRAAKEILSLPIYPGLTENQLDYIIQKINAF